MKYTKISTNMDQEEYIWAMRMSVNEEATSRQPDSETALFMSKSYQVSRDLESEQSKSSILASFVPDELLLNLNNYATQTFEACVLCGDVSGFTELCEKYNETGMGGPSRLTDALNNFIGAMVQEIMAHGGDVIKFSGDAFLVVWKLVDRTFMRDLIHDAINCALIIQKSHNNFITDVGVCLKVKLAISTGMILFSLIGNEKMSHYFECGQPILDTKDILDISQPGDIILSKTAWFYADSLSFLFEEIPMTNFIRVQGVGPGWRQAQKVWRRRLNVSERRDSRANSSSSSSSENSLRRSILSEFTLRPFVNLAIKNVDLYDELKKFINTPLMERIELNEPLEGLTELRQITVIMVNIIPQSSSFDSLIQLVKRIYKIMTVHATTYSGCINKVSCFDKDLMCVIIFGLRGMKHDLECLNALRCAGNLYGDIDVLAKVKDVSVGVVTGKTYCGVFGHTLRREYTVIGQSVNKAARLMVAYPNRVTCCNETFISSSMRDRYFRLQPYAYLKGIKNPGPVYEFKFEMYQMTTEPRVPIYPILGRNEEMAVYVKVLKTFLMEYKKGTEVRVSEPYHKMIFLEGEAKVGKTRLVEEFVYTTPPGIKVNMISSHIPEESFYGIRNIFGPAMGLSKKASTEEKQIVLKEAMKGVRSKDNLLCALNVVFGVKFPVTHFYENLPAESKVKMTGHALRQLAILTFKTPWIVVLERMMGMDQPSWQFLPNLLKTKTLFLIGLSRTDKQLEFETYKWIYISKYVKHIMVKRIDNLYLAALACQMLNVDAVPPDLEFALQSRSNGCAGWISNFLVSLQHSNAISIETVTYEQIHRKGLIIPPLYMMKRLTYQQLQTWSELMEERTKNVKSRRRIIDDWSIYVDTCRDSFTNIWIRQELNNSFEETKTELVRLKACFLGPDFESFNALVETSEESKIISKFDSMVYMEQLVAKCSSVLGRQFPRKLLEYVMPQCTTRAKAEAVRKLFELKIFACSKGDFTEAGDYVVVRDQTVNDNDTAPIECHCIGLDIPECCLDLPKYASCGFIHFKSQKVKEETYNLLPETQKVEFHTRAVRYLEKNTRKCRACGNGFFVEFTGKVNKLIKFVRKGALWHRFAAPNTSLNSLSHSPDSSSQLTQSVNISQSINYSDTLQEQQLSPYALTMGLVTTTKLNKLRESISLTRTFSVYDFSSCECNAILNSTYEQCMRHYKAISAYNELLGAMLQYVKTCIIGENMTEAHIVLKEIYHHIKNHGIGPNEPSWKKNMYLGKTMALRSLVVLKNQQIDAAIEMLYKAMEHYKSPFPRKNTDVMLQRLGMKLRHKLRLYMFPDSFGKNLKHSEIKYYNDKAECLSIFTDVFLVKKLFRKAELSATWALHCALTADSDFKLITKCFSDMLHIAQLNRNTTHCLALEVHALRYCHKKIANIDREDLKFVAVMYQRIRHSRMMRSELEKTIYIGYICLRMSIAVNHITLIFEIIPPVVVALMLKLYLQEATSLINELDYYSTLNELPAGRINYYSCCLMFLIETGFTMTPYEECAKYHYIEDVNLNTKQNPEEQMMFVTLMWLWNLRMKRWEYAQNWKNTIEDFLKAQNQSSLVTNHVSLYLLEGVLLCLVHAKNCQNYYRTMKYDFIAKRTIKNLRQAGKFNKVLLPRLKRFEAYYKHIQGKEEEAIKLIEETLVLSAKYEHSLEVYHGNHSKEAWLKTLTHHSLDQWVRRASRDNMLPFYQVDPDTTRVITYTLPTPIYE